MILIIHILGVFGDRIVSKAGNMIARILTVTCFVVIVAFFSRLWAGYAVLGLFLGLAIGFVNRHLRRSTLLRWFFAFLIVVSGYAVALSVFFSRDIHQDVLLPQIIEVNYTASISPSPGTSQWQIREEFLIPDTELMAELLYLYSDPDEVSNTDTSDALAVKIKRQLQLYEWTSVGFVGASEQLRRDRNLEAKLDWISATTILAIPIRIGYLQLYDREIRFVPDSKSEITITSPKHVVASTFPAYTSRQDVLRDGQERLTIPLEFARLDQPEFKIAVLNPLLRWPLGPKIGAFSLWSSIQWILLAICAVFSDQIKEKILKPIVAPLFRPKKENDKDEADGETPNK